MSLKGLILIFKIHPGSNDAEPSTKAPMRPMDERGCCKVGGLRHIQQWAIAWLTPAPFIRAASPPVQCPTKPMETTVMYKLSGFLSYSRRPNVISRDTGLALQV